jgi:hypothetical protein
VAEVHEDDWGLSTSSIWVTWNGDTRTAYWRFSWVSVGSEERTASRVIQRTSFETRFDVPPLAGPLASDLVEALDADGRVLVKTNAVEPVRSGLGGFGQRCGPRVGL